MFRRCIVALSLALAALPAAAQEIEIAPLDDTEAYLVCGFYGFAYDAESRRCLPPAIDLSTLEPEASKELCNRQGLMYDAKKNKCTPFKFMKPAKEKEIVPKVSPGTVVIEFGGLWVSVDDEHRMFVESYEVESAVELVLGAEDALDAVMEAGFAVEPIE